MASIEQIKGSDGSGNANLATIQNTRSPGATTIIVDTVLGINGAGFMGSMGTPHTFTDPVTSETITVISEATAVDFSGHVDGSNLEIDDIAPGYTDAGSAVGDIVIIRPTTQWSDNVAEVLEAAHNDDGTLNTTAIHSATPAGVVLPYAGATAPTGYLLCDGSSVLRADYPDLFTAISTTFGSADGTHFNVPDMRGRAAVGVGTNTWNFSFASTDVNTTTDQIAVTANLELITGRKIQLTTTGTLPTGLATSTDYYIIVIDSTHIQLASSLANAVAGAQIDITGAGSGTNTATHTGTSRTRGTHGGEEGHSNTITETPSHTHSHLYVNGDTGFPVGVTGTSGESARVLTSAITGATTAGRIDAGPAGGSGSHNNMQPFLVLNHIIKY
ncbi:MAG: phage tail protein [Pseudomonadota bacterium]